MARPDCYLATDIVGLPNAQSQLLPLENAILKNFENRGDVQQAIHEAITFAAVRHNGQLRNSGEPQMVHPLRAMAHALNVLGDHPNIVKILRVIALHDVIEDTPTTHDELEDQFGSDVALAVDILSKKRNHITKEEYAEKTHGYFENLLALRENTSIPDEVKELVFCAKVADRLENIETLKTLVKPGSMRRREAVIKKQRYIAETKGYIIPLLPEGNALQHALIEETNKQEALLGLAA